MRAFSVVAVMLAITPLLPADPLTQADRDKLIEKLEDIEKSTEAQTDARFATAVAAFRNAAADDKAVLELYLRCKEKIDFTDHGKKPQEFRDWKRSQEGLLSNPAFLEALRYQLRWLVLTLEVASSKKDISTFGTPAMQMTDEVLAQGEKLMDQRPIISQAALSTVFAQAYNLKSVKVKGWPASPMDTETLFESLIMPPLRNPEKIDTLRAAWMKRIQQQTILATSWTKDPATLTSYQRNGYPDMVWQMEVDLYQSGDERGAALRMFQFVEKYSTSPKAAGWAQQLKALLTHPGEPLEPLEPDDSGANGAPASATARSGKRKR